MMMFFKTLFLLVCSIIAMANGVVSETMDDWLIKAGHVTADGKVVTDVLGKGTQCKTLNMNNQGLDGMISAKIGEMTSLEKLSLESNRVVGGIPKWIGNLVKLVVLDMGSNQLVGNLPKELGKLVKLESLWLSSNQLGGDIPKELGNLVKLVQLDLSSNRLAGNIPKELGKLVNLVSLYLHNNRLVGDIPRELGNMVKLEYMFLSENRLVGEIPGSLMKIPKLGVCDIKNPGLCQGSGKSSAVAALCESESSPLCEASKTVLDALIELGHFTADGTVVTDVPGKGTQAVSLFLTNKGLVGVISEKIKEMVALEILYLNDNKLEGPIPKWLGSLQKLHYLWLANNRLTGTIPRELGKLLAMESLTINDNLLKGEIPSELGQLRRMKHLFLENNFLSGRIPGALMGARQIMILGNCDLSGNLALCQGAMGQSSNQVAMACKGQGFTFETCKGDVGFQAPVAADFCDTGIYRNPSDTQTIKGSCIDMLRCTESGRSLVHNKCPFHKNKIKCCHT